MSSGYHKVQGSTFDIGYEHRNEVYRNHWTSGVRTKVKIVTFVKIFNKPCVSNCIPFHESINTLSSLTTCKWVMFVVEMVESLILLYSYNMFVKC